MSKLISSSIPKRDADRGTIFTPILDQPQPAFEFCQGSLFLPGTTHLVHGERSWTANSLAKYIAHQQTVPKRQTTYTGDRRGRITETSRSTYSSDSNRDE